MENDWLNYYSNRIFCMEYSEYYLICSNFLASLLLQFDIKIPLQLSAII